MRKNEIDLMILGSLLLGPAHGYEIKRRIGETFGALYPNLSHSVLYPRLAQFEKERFITCTIEPQRDAPSRKVYRLTEAGFKRIKVLTATPVRLAGSSGGTYADELAVHIVFFSLITKEERRDVIEPYYCITMARYDDAVKKMEKYASENIDKFNLAFLEHGALLLKYTIELYEKLMALD